MSSMTGASIELSSALGGLSVQNAMTSEPLSALDSELQRKQMSQMSQADTGRAPHTSNNIPPPVDNRWVDEQGVAVETNFVNFFSTWVFASYNIP